MSTTTETTINVQLTPQDIIRYVEQHKLVPEGKFYSVEVKGRGISQGATLIIKHSNTRESESLSVL